MRLIDADANIETMKKCAANPESEQALLCYRFAQRILEEAPTVEPASPWHRVEDVLPKEVGSYLTAYCDGFVCENQWHYIGSTAIGWVNDAEAVRYWMPLPEPPKEDA